MAIKKKTKAAPKKKVAAKKSAAKKAAPKKVQAVPTDVPQLTPYFSVSDAAKAIEFYKQVFGARVHSQMTGPDGKIAHASLKIGNSLLMLSEPMNGSPDITAGKSSGVMLYVKDTDAVFQKAISLGARQMVPVSNMFWGDRWGMFEDPSGNLWQIATHLEDVKPAEMQRRAMESMGAGAPPVTDAGTPPPPPEDITTEHVAQA
ncbi:MAG: VOC family protein [Archangiaceae bacterium]|nr:VOC family protein [Archangiaceae bacterium]